MYIYVNRPRADDFIRVKYSSHTVSDISKLRALGWEPTIPVEENVAQYGAWLKDQQASIEYLLAAEKLMQEQGVIMCGKVV
ncbi:MAG: hypothetical protein HY672_01405 [Chloroflexi bacterium]|nr:hypothetical protein [Chloroflexota bacterium]